MIRKIILKHRGTEITEKMQRESRAFQAILLTSTYLCVLCASVFQIFAFGLPSKYLPGFRLTHR